MNQRTFIFFDLDGTLTDPGEGIINSLIYALRHFDIEGDPDTLAKFIGPPLLDSFQRFYGFDEAKARQAIKVYREYFNDHGVLANYEYPGITELLLALTDAGKRLAVATSKPTIYAVQVLEHFKLDRFFPQAWIIGSFLDGTRTNKAELIAEALRVTGAVPEDTVMVGDRKFDILGAKANGMDAIGVTYGYGEEQELKEAGALHVVHSVEELKSLLLG